MASAHEAIEVLESRSDTRIIFTDVNMPSTMDGLTLVRLARDSWRPIKIIVTSGRSDKLAELPTGGRFLAKPYTAEQVQSVVRAVIRHILCDFDHEITNEVLPFLCVQFGIYGITKFFNFTLGKCVH